MSRYDRLMTRARAGERILIDGATGSECLVRGVPELDNGWSGGAVLSHPEIVREIHAEYLALGVDLIASNTFATGRNVLEGAGRAGDFELANRRAVELAIEARADAGRAADNVVVAGGISNWTFAGPRPSLSDLEANTVEQATIMRDAGADLFSLEMMVDIPRMTATLDAVASLDLPVWVGLTVGPEEGHDVAALGDEVRLREGDLMSEAIEVAKRYDAVDALCLMHTDVRLAERGVAAIRAGWDGPLGVYAHTARIEDGSLLFEDNITPAAYAAYEPAWRAAGATMIGGCCGIGPRHIEVLATIGR